MVKCWDARVNPGEDGSRAAFLSLDHGAPVEALLYFPSGNILVSAGGSYMKVWDVLGGGAGSDNLLHTSQHHLKAITSLCLDGSASRLLTGSLDCHVKVLDVATYNVTYALKYASPVLGVALLPTVILFAIAKFDVVVNIVTRAIQVAGGSQSFALRHLFDLFDITVLAITLALYKMLGPSGTELIETCDSIAEFRWNARAVRKTLACEDAATSLRDLYLALFFLNLTTLALPIMRYRFATPAEK